MNAFSYDPDRKVDLFIMAGNGISFMLGGSNGNGKWSLYSRGGMEFDWYVSKHSTIFIDGLVGVYDVVNPKRWFDGSPAVGACNAYVGLGYMYNFGLTKADQELLAQKGSLRNDNCDALNDQINDLASELASCKQNERKLENRVNDLENELAMCRKGQGQNNDSELQKRIDQMKNDQLKYYAMPFSINYATNQSEVPAAEQVKVKTIAKIMNEDKDLKLTVVGFCDATGSDEVNQRLSEKRAENVKKMLVNKYGIDEDRLTCQGKGKTIVFGDGACAIDRRVSFYRMID
jgi:outer membrane protein OmpA-like peptidoglycan-associated protein